VTVQPVIAEIGRLLAPDHGAWRSLLASHVSDAGGHCAGCRSTVIGSPVWPCRLRVVAEEAQRVWGARESRPRTPAAGCCGADGGSPGG
jgi:hypothetical protein